MKHLKGILYFLGTIAFTIGVTSGAFAGGTTNQGFIVNEGQWPEHVWARATFEFGDVIVQKDGILFFIRDHSEVHKHPHGAANLNDTVSVVHAHVYKMKFRDGAMNKPHGYESGDFKVNYIKGNNSANWASNLSCYRKLVLENVYRNVDLVLYVTNGGIKYDLILKANADPSRIRIDYDGIDDLSIDEEGNLKLKTSLGTVVEKTPIAFVERNTRLKEPVVCNYILEGNSVRFKVKNISRARKEKLVIDPELIFATYSGSTADNWGNTATYDSLGNLYAAGIVFGSGFPVTLGAYDISYNGAVGGDHDVAIMKFSATGSLVYATYLGGGLAEVPTSIIVNSDNELYILGTTSSNGSFGSSFPTTVGAYDRTFNGGSNFYPLGQFEGIRYHAGSDLFISKLSATGSTLLSSTLLGGSGNDGLLLHTETLSRNYGDEFRSEILLDSLGFVYIASHTQSNNILNAARPGFNLTYSGGGRDGIVVKFTEDLSDIVWNTYWGGTNLDACYSLQFGINNDLFIAGGTMSNDMPAAGGLNTALMGGVDGFVLKVSAVDGSYLASTYIGTTSIDQCYLIQTDQNGFVYVLGQSQGSYTVMNAPYANAGSHQFIHKLNNDLSQTVFSTVIGSGEDKTDFVPTAFLVNDCENIFVSGWGGSVNYPFTVGGILHGPYYQGGSTRNLPLTSTAFQKNTDDDDFYLMVLKKDVASLLYATYFGGIGEREHVDGGTSRFDKKGIVYQSVCAGCGGTSKFPVTPGAYSRTNNSFNCNNAVFKFDLSSLKADFTVDTTKLCGSGPVTFTNTSLGGAIFIWDLGDGSTSNSAGTFTHTYKDPGTYVVRLIAFDEATCIGRDTAEKTVEVFALPELGINFKSLSICKGDTAQITGVYNSDYTYLWSPNEYINDINSYNPKVYPPSTKKYKVVVTNTVTQCKGFDSVIIHVYNPVVDVSYENITGCQGQPTVKLINTNSEGFNYLWNFGDGIFQVDFPTVTHAYSHFGEYTVVLKIFNDQCNATDTLKIVIPAVNIPNLITPNGDQLNDKYVIEGMTNNWIFDVYNRWGDLIYTREPYDQSWGGEGLSEGVYYYLITDPAGNKCKGWVHIIK
jgi:gliding motility-associated-like protein